MFLFWNSVDWMTKVNYINVPDSKGCMAGIALDRHGTHYDDINGKDHDIVGENCWYAYHRTYHGTVSRTSCSQDSSRNLYGDWAFSSFGAPCQNEFREPQWSNHSSNSEDKSLQSFLHYYELEFNKKRNKFSLSFSQSREHLSSMKPSQDIFHEKLDDLWMYVIKYTCCTFPLKNN